MVRSRSSDLAKRSTHFEKGQIVTVVEENLLAIIATIDDVLDQARRNRAEPTWHAHSIKQSTAP
jgi:hypothetical protein